MCALWKCVYWLEVFIRWALWPKNFLFLLTITFMYKTMQYLFIPKQKYLLRVYSKNQTHVRLFLFTYISSQNFNKQFLLYPLDIEQQTLQNDSLSFDLIPWAVDPLGFFWPGNEKYKSETSVQTRFFW